MMTAAATISSPPRIGNKHPPDVGSPLRMSFPSEVSTLVNSVKNNKPEVLEPWSASQHEADSPTHEVMCGPQRKPRLANRGCS